MISSHTKKVTNSNNETNGKTCTKCLTYTIVYKAEVESPGTTTIQCHLETGHMKMIQNFQNIFGV